MFYIYDKCSGFLFVVNAFTPYYFCLHKFVYVDIMLNFYFRTEFLFAANNKYEKNLYFDSS